VQVQRNLLLKEAEEMLLLPRVPLAEVPLLVLVAGGPAQGLRVEAGVTQAPPPPPLPPPPIHHHQVNGVEAEVGDDIGPKGAEAGVGIDIGTGVRGRVLARVTDEVEAAVAMATAPALADTPPPTTLPIQATTGKEGGTPAQEAGAGREDEAVGVHIGQTGMIDEALALWSPIR